MKTATYLGGVLLVAAFPLTLACSGATSPTSPQPTALSLRQALVSVNGTSLNGMTVSRDHSNGAATRFEAMLMGADGRPVSGSRVTVRYTRPGGMMMKSGEFMLYDDGTHGDPIVGDGIYCYEDLGYQYGCGGYGMVAGEYHYEFYGTHHDGSQSNHMDVTVTLR